MKTVAIITARGGSKRIPRKNIREFMGRPMIAYAIDASLRADIFDTVMVSTDDAEIADISRGLGAEVPFMRSEKTANDFATTADVLCEVLDNYKKLGKRFDNLCCIYPCVPFLKSDDLKTAARKFAESKADSLLPIVRFSFPIQRALMVNKNDFLEYREPKFVMSRSQDLDPMFHDVGMFYFSKIESFLRDKRLVGEKAAYIELDESVVQDIDNDSDWKMAEMKYKLLNEK